MREAATVGRWANEGWTEGWRVRRDGSRFWASVVITRLVGPDGTARGFAKVVRTDWARTSEPEKLKADQLATRWGAKPSDQGKAVWFELARQPAPAQDRS